MGEIVTPVTPLELVSPVQGKTAAPRRVLSTTDGVVLVVGLIVGAGIFRAPPIVAANVSDGLAFLLVWVGGGAIALIGALCYAELAGAYPHPGGEYYVLRRAFGRQTAFLFGWSRLTVMQTGSIALLAFLFADYAVRLLPGTGGKTGGWIDATIAAAVVVVLTLINAAGLRPGRKAQYLLTGGEFMGVLALIVAGCVVALRQWPVDPAAMGGLTPDTGLMPTDTQKNLALAFVFVMLTYGGWSEAAYLSAELRDRRRGVQRTLIGGVVIVTLLYVMTNAAYMIALRLEGVASSTAVAVDVMQAAAGTKGAVIVGLIVMIAALSSVNATMITGARGSFAVGKDVSLLSPLGTWHTDESDEGGTPRRALVVQGGLSLLLVVFGAAARSGFETMVAYTAPVFWLTLLLMGIALFVLRQRDPAVPRPFRVPWYPLTPLLFCITSAAMLYSSIAYAGRGALLGVAVMLVGIPVLLVARRIHKNDPQSQLDPVNTIS